MTPQCGAAAKGARTAARTGWAVRARVPKPYGYARVVANVATAYVPLGDTARVLHYTGDIDPAVEQADSDWSRALSLCQPAGRACQGECGVA